jgi:hypothetical protein
MLGRVEDRGAVIGERDRLWSEGAAELALRGRADRTVVSVAVVGGESSELVAGELCALLVCSALAARGSGEMSSSVVGVAGQ